MATEPMSLYTVVKWGGSVLVKTDAGWEVAGVETWWCDSDEELAEKCPGFEVVAVSPPPAQVGQSEPIGRQPSSGPGQRGLLVPRFEGDDEFFHGGGDAEGEHHLLRTIRDLPDAYKAENRQRPPWERGDDRG